VSNACATRAPRGVNRNIDVTHDPDILAGHLEDAAHYPGGHAAGVAFPRSEADAARLVQSHPRILPVGSQSSLTGGATPFGDVVVSMRRFSGILSADATRVVVQPGATLADVEAALRPYGASFPPAPTFLGASAGGSVATNAAGAATFKYGSVREWVEALTIVLANGEVLEVRRGECLADDRGFVIETARSTIRVPVPTYRMPDVAKRSAGYHAAPGMDLIDLFIGAEGTLGIVTEITFRVLGPAPAIALGAVFCPTEAIAMTFVTALRDASIKTRRERDGHGIDACAIEHIDDRSLAMIDGHGDLATLGVTIPDGTALALLVQLELPSGTTTTAAFDAIQSALSPDAVDSALVRFCRLVDRFGLLDRTELAAPGDLHRQQQLMHLREAVPARVNQLVGAAKRDVDPRIEKTAADMIVPFERFAEMMEIYRRGFASRDLDFAIWGHISDGNVHPNVIPHSYEDVQRGKEAILEFGRAVADLGGCPLAEHGVGRNRIKQELLRQLYGSAGIDEMRAVKRALDPEWKLAPGVIFPA
jgi:D-lactate dehydrogenase (cytochrome)